MSNAGEMMTNEQAIDILKNLMAMKNISFLHFSQRLAVGMAIEALKEPEILTYDEQCIFLAAMGREKKLCEKLDKNLDSPPKTSLNFICKEIERKVKATLWRKKYDKRTSTYYLKMKEEEK